ncbi:hypothetical protein [Natrialba sp. PRR66]|uniref:hypothetical protein n=1 Tax=Natrialba sp. PRR66 TaxID=3098146 RepID=UPI002B1D0906|nr:hypothetical protein [Natrialba sp. PRR66]
MSWYKQAWYDETHFPSKGEFDSSFEFGEGVYSAILKRYRTLRGGTPNEDLRKTAQCYAHVYAFSKWNEKLVLPTEDINFVVDIPFDNPSDHIYESQTERIVRVLTKHGWFQVDTDYCFQGSEWENCEYLLVYQQDRRNEMQPIIPDFNKILTKIGSDRILSHTIIYDYIKQRLDEVNVERSIEERETVAYTAAIETRLLDYGWVQLGAKESKDRLWIEPDRLFDYLMDRFAGETTISDMDLQDELRDFIVTASPNTKDGAEFNLSAFEDPFFRKIRSHGWNKIRFEDSVTWYRTEEAQKEALTQKIDRYSPILESPSSTDFDEKDVRNAAYRFFSQNKSVIIRNDFYERGFIHHQLRLLDYYREADESFEELHEAETAAGKWTIVPNSGEDGDNESEESEDKEKETE